MTKYTKTLTLLFLLTPITFFAQALLLDPLNTVFNGSILNPETAVQNGLYYVAATDGTHGYELWRSDGTPAGTFMLKDINADQNSTEAPFNFKASGDSLLFFMATDGASGYELWVTDGTSDGTLLVKEFNDNPGQGSFISGMTDLNGKLYFGVDSPDYGRELWVSDGTPEGTQMVKDISDGAASGFQSSTMALFNNKLYFAARESFNDLELWVSDGTAAGTRRLYDILPGNGSGLTGYDPIYATPVGVFFVANDGVHGPELWMTNGDSLQTRMVKDINPSTVDVGAYMVTDYENYGWYNNKLLFIGYSGASAAEELWCTDGTAGGTTLLKTFDNGSLGYAEYFCAAPQGMFFLTYENTTGRELYISDGSVAGTHLVKDIVVGTLNGVFPQKMQVAGNTLYFSAGDYFVDAGIELWSSDGTEAGTSMFLDHYTGPASSFPAAINLRGNQLVFAATQTNIPQGLFAIEVNTVPVKGVLAPEMRVSVWPQPASDRVHINFQNGERSIDRILLTHPDGRQTLLLDAPAAQYDWDCSKAPSGVYTLLVVSGVQACARTVLVQH